MVERVIYPSVKIVLTLSIKRVNRYDSSVETEKYLLTSDGLKININENRISDRYVVILTHGFLNHKETEPIAINICKLLELQGISSITFDFRAHGKSQGKLRNDFTINGCIEDTLAVYKYAEKNYKKIILIGVSFGASISSCLAPKLNLSGLILLNPLLDYHESYTKFSKIAYDFYKLDEQIARKMRPLDIYPFNNISPELITQAEKLTPWKELNHLNIPVIIIQGTYDTIISPENTCTIFNQIENKYKKLILVKNGTHGFKPVSELKCVGNQTQNLIKNCFKNPFFKLSLMAANLMGKNKATINPQNESTKKTI
ncbi:MAG: alpha/beta fold hydrolase [Niabella sp.]|nr:MAG: alpha/beta fold hydrolase [Niabella sp.]